MKKKMFVVLILISIISISCKNDLEETSNLTTKEKIGKYKEKRKKYLSIRKKMFNLFFDEFIEKYKKTRKISALNEFLDNEFIYDNFYKKEKFKHTINKNNLKEIEKKIDYKIILEVLEKGTKEVGIASATIYYKNQDIEKYPNIVFYFNENINKWRFSKITYVFD